MSGVGYRLFTLCGGVGVVNEMGWGVWYRISSVYFVWGSGVVNEMGVGCLV